MAENTCDAVVAPLLWGAVAGVGGLLGYRAVNTLDAMVGHHSMRYERFGWAAARLDDVANLVPARLTALLAAALAPAVGGSGRAALRTVRRDGAAHPSPNAGRCEAAFAGALGVSLGGTNVYQGRPERRGTLGDGPPPTARDLARAVWLSRLVRRGAAHGGGHRARCALCARQEEGMTEDHDVFRPAEYAPGPPAHPEFGQPEFARPSSRRGSSRRGTSRRGTSRWRSSRPRTSRWWSSARRSTHPGATGRETGGRPRATGPPPPTRCPRTMRGPGP